MAQNGLAKANAEKTKAERAEDARWARCNGCDMSRRIVDGMMVEHNRWDVTTQGMVWCSGSGQPVQAGAAPQAVFTD